MDNEEEETLRLLEPEDEFILEEKERLKYRADFDIE